MPSARHFLIGTARILAAHSPTLRAVGQTFQIALRLQCGEEIYRDARRGYSAVEPVAWGRGPSFGGLLTDPQRHGASCGPTSLDRPAFFTHTMRGWWAAWVRDRR